MRLIYLALKIKSILIKLKHKNYISFKNEKIPVLASSV